MRYFLKKQIHASCSAYSSEDAWLIKEVNEEEFNKYLIEDISVSDRYGYSIKYAISDKYYTLTRGLFGAPKHEFNDYVNSLLVNGWELDNVWLKEQQNKQWADEEEKRLQERISEGYVIPRWSDNLKPEDYKGGFSDFTFNQKIMQDYLSGGGCHGYIGHSVRKPELDEYLEKSFFEVCGLDSSILPNFEGELLAAWLCARDGRHFGDSLEGFSFEEQKDYINKNINSIVRRSKELIKYYE